MTINLHKSIQNKYFYRLILIIACLEFSIMFLMYHLHHYIDFTVYEPFIDVFLLLFFGYPLLMKFVVQPYSKENNIIITQELNEKSNELKELNLSLEKKVLDKTHEIIQSNDKLQAIWNIEKNIIIFTNGKELKDANPSFFKFFHEYKTIKEFKKEHDCICDFFERQEDDNYLYKDIGNMLWTTYMLQNPDKHWKIAIRRKNALHFFSVHAKKLTLAHDKNILITFNEITDSQNYQNFLESYQETLKLKIKEETNSLRKKDEIMLAQSRQAAMGELISMIAHQWRQPITAIGMAAQNMQLDIELEDINPEVFDTKLTKIVEQTHFLSTTIDDFRDFLKPNKKTKSSKLTEILEGTLNIIEKSLQNNDITLEKSYKKDTKINTYPNEVIQVLINIINNAKDIIKIKKINNGVINFNINFDEENAYFKICDNAGGIPEDILPKIFEPYFTTKEEKGGTGLGLYMSKMIIEKHLKGTIKVENTPDGACFTISLPMDIKYDT